MTTSDGQGVGASLTRKEDDRFLRGRGQYVGDIRLAEMKDVAFVRSPDKHSIELLQRGSPLPPKEPWISMPNTGKW